MAEANEEGKVERRSVHLIRRKRVESDGKSVNQARREEKGDAKLRCQTEIAPTATASSLEDRQAPSAAVRAITGSFYFGSVRLGLGRFGTSAELPKES